MAKFHVFIIIKIFGLAPSKKIMYFCKHPLQLYTQEGDKSRYMKNTQEKNVFHEYDKRFDLIIGCLIFNRVRLH